MKLNIWFFLLQTKNREKYRILGEIKDRIETINGDNPIDFMKDFMKAWF